MNNTYSKIFTLAFAILLALSAGYSQKTEDIISAQAFSSKKSVEKGQEFDILVDMKIKDGWYTYYVVEVIGPEGIGPTPTEFFVKEDSPFEVLDYTITSKTTKKFDTGFKVDVETYKKKAQFLITAKAKENIQIDGSPIIWTYIQVCDTSSCLPGTELPYPISYSPDIKSKYTSLYAQLDKRSQNTPTESPKDSIPVTIDSSDSSKPKVSLTDTSSTIKDNQSETPFQSEAEREIEQAKNEGAWSYFFLAMSFGALALLTPCVFPMIPITVSFFTKRSESENSRPVFDALLFALGIIATFVAIGLITAAIFGAGSIGDIATNPWINIAIAAVFIIFALNLFGAFEIQIPTSILNKLNTKANSGGRGGIMLMGLVFSLTSFTCTVPFVGTSLLSTADGEWFMPVVGMLGFAFVFAIPFFLLALFPSLLKKLPKSGGWMNNLKVVMGFVEIAAALKFISNVDLVWGLELLSRQNFVAIWIAIAVLIGLYILGVFILKLDSPVDRLSAVRVIFAIVFFSIGISFVPGLWNEPLGEIDSFLPPREYMNEGKAYGGFGGGSAVKAEVWHKTLDKALDVAKKENKNVFVDFTGWTCTNCRKMESNVFPKVQDQLNQYVKAKLYTDRRKEPELGNKALMEEKFGSIALPLYVIMRPDGTVIDKVEYEPDVDKFTSFLNKGLN
ncbi:MAG: cytochrome c biogenesis protein CcdA [Candidatus Kapaibacteriales bacterium]